MCKIFFINSLETDKRKKRYEFNFSIKLGELKKTICVIIEEDKRENIMFFCQEKKLQVKDVLEEREWK